MAVSKKGLCFRSKYITDELARIFTEDTDREDEEFEGFDEEASPDRNDWVKRMSEESEDDAEDDAWLYSEETSKAPARRRSSGLCVAFRFPTKKGPLKGNPDRTRKQEHSDSEGHDHSGPVASRVTARGGRGRRAVENVAPPQMHTEPLQFSAALDPEPKKGGAGDEDQSQALQKRAENIKENKAMLEKLLAELNSMPQLFPLKAQSVSTPSKRKRSSPKKAQSDSQQSERRNPTRSARPPAHFGVEDFSISPSKLIAHLGDIKKARVRARLTEVNPDGSRLARPHRRSSKHIIARTVDDITEEELDNVAYTSKDKVYDKEHGSTCHQCRQKTLDTKTVCRNPKCWGVRGQFCGPCLRNRYGEDVRTALLDSMWVCPPCRGICNCSFCRKADGRCATGILIHMAKFYGHGNVKEYLESLQKNLS
ncbi:cell division cycle-associated 7-like protein [Megalops cyprinoides]|uniref:cell division cycle-associated 7-like protein n=1 Tax=Megalops cyprinoides TaxID=118141 RepID=UPI0018645ED8|nr:cell division cycle-associated 7-like protein [Megalops cyprinoides]